MLTGHASSSAVPPAQIVSMGTAWRQMEYLACMGGLQMCLACEEYEQAT